MSLEHQETKRPLLDVRGLKKYFPVKGPLGSLGGVKGYVKAVNDVSFHLYEGETLGIVGESGCGKSTMGRTILRLTDPTEGQALYKDEDIFQLSGKKMQPIRRDVQMVFQDPFSSLNPRKRIGQTLEEPLAIHSIGEKQERTERVMDIMNKVGLQLDHYYRYPHEFSGGQRQRIGLARALTYLFIAHDISVVRHISDRIGVMYLGQMVEQAPTPSLFATPLHPYTKALLSAVPIPHPSRKKERIVLRGEIPSPMNPPTGCIFHTRCPYVTDVCKTETPVKKEAAAGHMVACHLY